MSDGVYVAGTRTFAAEVVDFVVDAGLRPLGLLEPYARERVGTTIHELPVTWLDDGAPLEVAPALVGTGERDREAVAARLAAAGFPEGTLVHPRAHVAPTTTVAPGAVIAPGVVVGARSAIGRYAALGRGALVGHHTRLGDFVSLGPGANVAGNVTLGRDVFLGMGAVVRDHVTVGDGAVVAMGAVVVRDVAPRTEVRGVPAAPFEG